jgi:hypothetical protein
MDLQEQLLRSASEASTFVANHLLRHGDWRMVDYVRSLRTGPDRSLQPRHELWQAIAAEAAAHYGEATAAIVVEELLGDPIAPTSNHFGIDTLADSVQGTLLFGLRPLPGGPRRRTVVVLGFGSVSLNNLTYPMGLLLYDLCNGKVSELPQRLPVLPGRLKQCTVSAVGPFDAEMVDRARSQLRRSCRSGERTTFCQQAADAALAAEFLSPRTLALPSYRRQATHLNACLWRRMFRDPRDAPQLVQLEIEAICARILQVDLFDDESLAHQLFFVPPVREAVLAELDGARACWRRDQLSRRLGQKESRPGPGGTIFFWGLSEGARRIPLTLHAKGPTLLLAGVDETGQVRSWEFSPHVLAAALAARELLPSLFTCFAVVAFSRGFACVGGYYQVAYLPVMQRGICRAIGGVGGNERAAELVSSVPSDGFLAGLQGIVSVADDGSVLPAGPLEVAAAGGLAPADLVALEFLTIREGSLAAFTELFAHVAPDVELPSGWTATLAAENGQSCPSLVRMPRTCG